MSLGSFSLLYTKNVILRFTHSPTFGKNHRSQDLLQRCDPAQHGLLVGGGEAVRFGTVHCELVADIARSERTRRGAERWRHHFVTVQIVVLHLALDVVGHFACSQQQLCIMTSQKLEHTRVRKRRGTERQLWQWESNDEKCLHLRWGLNPMAFGLALRCSLTLWRLTLFHSKTFFLSFKRPYLNNH